MRNFIYFVLVACFWSGSFVAIEPLVAAMPPLLAGCLRIAVAVIFMATLLPIMKVPYSLPKAARLQVYGTGLVAFSIPFALLFWGERSVSPGVAGVLNGTVPIWVFVLGALLTPGVEPITKDKVIGILLGFGGVVAIFAPKALAAEHDPSLFGVLAVTGMAISYAFSVLLNRNSFAKFKTLNPITNLFHQLISGAVCLFIIAVLFEGWPQPSHWGSHLTILFSLLYLGCVSTCIAFILFYRLIQSWGSVRAATVTYVMPAFSLILDLLINGRLPTLNEMLGVFGITAGVLVLNFMGRKKIA